MAGIEAFLKGWVSRMLPQAEQDNDPGIARLSRYGDVSTVGLVRKQHALADEGTYFLGNNSGTGVATAAAPTSFSDTAPMFTIQNSDSAGNQNAKRIYLDWLRLTETAAGTGATDLRLRMVLDTTSPTGGTLLTPVCPNTDVPNRASVATPRILPVGIAQTGNSRVVVGIAYVIPLMTTPIAALSEVFLNFGGVEQFYPSSERAASALVYKNGYPMPPIIIGPGHSFSMQFLLTGQSAASSWTVEAGWWER